MNNACWLLLSLRMLATWHVQIFCVCSINTPRRIWGATGKRLLHVVQSVMGSSCILNLSSCKCRRKIVYGPKQIGSCVHKHAHGVNVLTFTTNQRYSQQDEIGRGLASVPVGTTANAWARKEERCKASNCSKVLAFADDVQEDRQLSMMINEVGSQSRVVTTGNET